MAFDIGSVVAKVKADTTDFQKGIGEVSKQTNVMGNVMSKLGVIIGTAFAVDKIIGFGKQASQEAMNMEKAMISLEIISGKFGVSADRAKEKANELGKSLRIGVSSSAESLQNLLKSGLNLDQATELMKRFTNEALTGKSANISLAQAVQNLSFAYATNNSALGNMSGIAENWSDIIDKGRISLEKQGVAVADITDEMAKYQGIIDLTNLTLGSSERFHDTLIDKQAELGIKVVELKVAVGEMLNPAIAILVDKQIKLVDALKELVSKIEDAKNKFVDYYDEILILGTFLGVTFIPLLIKIGIEAGISATVGMFKLINSIIEATIEGWKFVGVMIVKIAKFALATAAIILHTTVTIAQTTATGALTVATWSLNTALAVLTSPIFLVIAAITALIAIGVLLYKNWDVVKEKAGVLWKFLTDGFWSFVDVLKGIGGSIFEAIKEPFERAWNTVRDIMNKIKDALDFTKRHSPSVVDIVEKGVGLVNRALEGLTVGVEPINTSKLAFSGYGINGMNINIDLSGAYVGDDSIGEKIGDAIISRLQKNVRF